MGKIIVAIGIVLALFFTMLIVISHAAEVTLPDLQAQEKVLTEQLSRISFEHNLATRMAQEAWLESVKHKNAATKLEADFKATQDRLVKIQKDIKAKTVAPEKK